MLILVYFKLFKNHTFSKNVKRTNTRREGKIQSGPGKAMVYRKCMVLYEGTLILSLIKTFAEKEITSFVTAGFL